MSELDRIRSALAYIDAHDRDTWITIGMAIKSELGDEGFEIWDGWSKQADSYDPKDARDAWKSIKPKGKVGIGTLFHEAKNHGWQSDEPPRKLTADEIEARRIGIAAQVARFEAEKLENQKAAMREAAAILEVAVEEPATHPYIRQKKLRYVGQRVKRGYWPQRNWPDALLIPIYHPDKQIWSIEAINTDGEKDSLKNGKKSGGFHPFGKVTGADRVLIGEGFSTMNACHDSTGITAVAALSAGNLRAVAEAVRKIAPDAEITIIADNDIKPDGSNPGLKAATDAAFAFRASLAIPELDGRGCDFWDVWSERGPAYVKQAIAAANIPTLPLLSSSFKHRDYPGHDLPDQ